MKKALSLFLAFVMVVSLAATVGITANAEPQSDTQTFTVSVPNYVSCPLCGGNKTMKCILCNGTGGGGTCARCNGTKVMTCTYCSGSGKSAGSTNISVCATGKIEAGETVTLVNSTALIPVNFKITVGSVEHETNTYTFQESDIGSSASFSCIAVNNNCGYSTLYSLGTVAAPSTPTGFEYYAAGSSSAIVCKTWDDVSAKLTSGCTVKLISDVTLSSSITVADGQDFTLDLNGYTLNLNEHNIIVSGNLTVDDTSAGKTGVIKNGKSATTGDVANLGGAFVVIKNINPASLVIKGGTIQDCSALNGNGGAVAAMEGTTFEMLGGKLSSCFAKNGGGIFCYKSNVTISDALISFCNGTEYGGAIFNGEGNVTLNSGAIIERGYLAFGTDMMGGGIFNKGTLVMNEGAVIKNCSASKGAGVHNDGNSWVTFTMNGGLILNCTASKNGGAVQNSANATFNLYGGTITGNKATDSLGGGVFNKGTMVLSGAAVVVGNSNGNIATANEITVTGFTGSAGICCIDKVSGNYETIGGKVTNAGSAEYIDRFTSDYGKYMIIANASSAITLNAGSSAIISLRQYLNDEDEGVRDIATIYINFLIKNSEIESYVATFYYSSAIAKINMYKATSSAINDINSEAISSSAAVQNIASNAIAELHAASNIEDIEPIRSTAILAIRAQIASEALDIAKLDAIAAINAAAGEDEILQLYADIFIDAVNDSEDAQAVETFKQKAVNAFALVKAKAAAIKQLNSILGNEDEAIRAIASASIDEVKSSGTLTAEQVAEILSKAIADIEFEAYKNDAQAAVKAVDDAQNAAVVEIVSNAIADIEVATTKVAIDEIKSNALAEVALEKAKAAAIKVVEDEDVKSSAVAAGIASQAIADIKAAQTTEAVETLKTTAISAIREQLAAEALAAAKEAAIAEINSEAISSSAAMEAIVSGAIADVNAANTLEAVETARSAAIVAIRAQLVAEAPKTADYTVWFIVVAAVAMLGCATVAKKKFF